MVYENAQKENKEKESNPTISLYRYDKLINEIFKRIKSDKNIYSKAWTRAIPIKQSSRNNIQVGPNSYQRH